MTDGNVISMPVTGDVTQLSTTPAGWYELDYYPEMEELIHSHWRRFPPVSYMWHLLVALIVFGLGIVSISGNAAVAYIFTQTKGLRNASNALIVNLAVSDFAMMLTNCPLYFFSSLQGKWIFGVQACRFYGFCGALFGCASILTMTAIAIDRYLVICKPFLIMKSAMTRERAKLAIACVWTYSAIWASIPLTGITNYVLEGFLTTCTFDYLDTSSASRSFIFSMFCGAYVAPLLTIIGCYLLIIWEVYRHAKKFKAAASRTAGGKTKNEEEVKKKKEIKTAKIAALIIATWVLAWTPYAIVALMGIATNGSALTPIVSQLPALFCKTAGVYNPIVYAISHPKYRAALHKKFPFLICIKDDEEEERTSGRSSETSEKRGNLRKQMSTTSQTGSVDSELSHVDDPADTTATPQGRRRSSRKRTQVAPLEQAVPPAEPPIAVISNQGSAEARPVATEIVATYSKDNPQNVTFRTATVQSERVWIERFDQPDPEPDILYSGLSTFRDPCSAIFASKASRLLAGQPEYPRPLQLQFHIATSAGDVRQSPAQYGETDVENKQLTNNPQLLDELEMFAVSQSEKVTTV